MTCAACGSDNREGAHFCGACGTGLGLELLCGRCRRANPAGRQFCDGCGERLGEAAEPSQRDPRVYTPAHLARKILRSKSALEGERKQVTVLFADVKGSMELAAQVDPESWHAVLDRFFQILAEGVHRFEGTVNQYTGDGIMALFGAPIAHEDHAQRACHAALQLRDELHRYAQTVERERGLVFSVRMGINSGEVVVGKIGDDLRMDYTAQGYMVGLAARMQELAEQGSAYLTEDSAALVEDFFELEDLGPFTLKGSRGPLRIFRLEAAGPPRTSFDVSRARGLARFVAREGELRTLEDALADAQEGNGQVIGVVGEPGVGKSRLCFEFLESCRARGLRVIEARAVSHGRNVPFLPILQISRAYYGISEHDDDSEARERIAARLLSLDEEFRESLPLVFQFLGVADPASPAPPIDPEARQRQIFELMRRLAQQVDPQTPAVVLIENLEWIDPGSEAYIEQLVETIPAARTLLLLNFRPEYRAGWMQRPYYQELSLLPLSSGATRELLEHELGDDPRLARLTEAIRASSAGNPLFVEEVIRSLVDSGHLVGDKGSHRLVTPIDKLEVPGSVHALLTSRIDRLPDRDKRLLQTAAVIGREFAEPILEAVSELPHPELREALSSLESTGFVYAQSLHPVAEYSFTHPLTQEVALRSQLRDRRERTHVAVARAIEASSREKLDERAALLAYHWEEAGEALTAAQWHRRAALWAGWSRLEEARRHWKRVRALLPSELTAPEVVGVALEARLRLLDLLWRLGGHSPGEFDALFEEGRALADRLEDKRPLALLLGIGAIVLGMSGDLDLESAGERMLEAVRISDGTGDTATRLVLRWRLGYVFNFSGRLSEVLANTEEMIAISGGDWRPGYELTGFSPLHTALVYREMTLARMGRLEEARRTHERGMEIAQEIAEETGEHFFLGLQRMGLVLLSEMTGDRDADVVGAGLQAVEAAEKYGNSQTRVIVHRALASAHEQRGQWSEAIAAARRAEALAREKQTGLDLEPEWMRVLSLAHLGRGEVEKARALGEHAAERARNIGTRVFEIPSRLALVRALLASGDAEMAESVLTNLDTIFDLIDSTGAEGYRPLALVERARLALMLGDAVEGGQGLREAHDLFAKTGATGHAEGLRAELDALS